MVFYVLFQTWACVLIVGIGLFGNIIILLVPSLLERVISNIIEQIHFEVFHNFVGRQSNERFLSRIESLNNGTIHCGDVERNGVQFSLIYMHYFAKAHITDITEPEGELLAIRKELCGFLSILVFQRVLVKAPFGTCLKGPIFVNGKS